MEYSPASIAGMIFVTIASAGYAVYLLRNPSRSARDRLTELTLTDERGPSLLAAPSALGPMTRTLSRVAVPTDEEEISALRQRLIRAGYRGRSNVERFAVLRAFLTLLLPLAWLALPGHAPADTLRFEMGALSIPVWSLTLCLALATVGYYAPAVWVTAVLRRRQEEIRRALPDGLDLLCTAVEAGLGIDAAFRKVAEEIAVASPILAVELLGVVHEVAAGLPRSRALRHLYQRTGLDDVASLVNVLIQAERFGTPIANALRGHSRAARVRRMQRAEAAAARLSPYMTLAMIFFILPCLIVILVGPAIVNVRQVLFPTLHGLSF